MIFCLWIFQQMPSTMQRLCHAIKRPTGAILKISNPEHLFENFWIVRENPIWDVLKWYFTWVSSLLSVFVNLVGSSEQRTPIQWPNWLFLWLTERKTCTIVNTRCNLKPKWSIKKSWELRRQELNFMSEDNENYTATTQNHKPNEISLMKVTY